MNDPAAYLPIDRRYALMSGEHVPTEMRGALLFADIAGFTPLMQSYIDDLGKQRGTEELSGLLNEFFDAVIGPLHMYRGSVISFIGDGMICLFRDDDGRRAVSAACRVRETIRRFGQITTPAGREISLRLKMSVVAGDVERLVVGDPSVYQLDVVSGRAVILMEASEKVITPGEIVVHQPIAALFPNMEVIEVREAGDGERYVVCGSIDQPVPPMPWPSITNLGDKAIRPWLLPDIYERLTSGQQDFITELRIAVVSFLRFTLNEEGQAVAGAEIMDDLFRRVQRIVHDQGGYVFQLTIGDKGNNIFYAFGAPHSHEDDVERSLNTALELMALHGTLGYTRGFHIGISKGHFRTGPYGGKERCTYACLGAHTNLASRLSSRAQSGQILVSQDIVDKVRKFEFTPLGSLRIKGFARPVPLFALERKAAFAVHADTPDVCIGREHEKNILNQLINTGRSGPAGAWCFIEGESGIGKSSLSHWLIEEAKLAQFTTHVVRGEAISQRIPYQALHSLMREMLGFDSSWSLAVAQSHIRDFLYSVEPGLEKWAPLLRVVTEFEWEDTPETTALTAHDREKRILWLLHKVLLFPLRDSPMLLIVENAQWLDSSTADMLLPLMTEVPEGFVGCIVRRRYKDQTDVFAEVTGRPNVSTLSLGTLDKAALSDVLCNYLSVDRIDPEVLDVLHRKTGGHPLFSKTLLDTMLDDAVLTIDHEACRPSDLDANFSNIELPDSIHSAIVNRIDRLTPHQQLLLKVASILGEKFTYPPLEGIYPVSTEKIQLPRHLGQLEAAKLILKETANGAI